MNHVREGGRRSNMSCHAIIDHHDTLHVISCTRPSRFSACNIEKLGMDLGTRLGLFPGKQHACGVLMLIVAAKFKLIDFFDAWTIGQFTGGMKVLKCKSSAPFASVLSMK